MVNVDTFGVEFWYLQWKVTGFSMKLWCSLITNVSFCLRVTILFWSMTSHLEVSPHTVCWITNELWSWHSAAVTLGTPVPTMARFLFRLALLPRTTTSWIIFWYISSSWMPPFCLQLLAPFLSSASWLSPFPDYSVWHDLHLLVPGSNSTRLSPGL